MGPLYIYLLIYPIEIEHSCIKGQFCVPLTVYPWYFLCSTLGFLRMKKPINTIKYPRAIGLIYRFPIGVRWDRGTSSYPLKGGRVSALRVGPGAWRSRTMDFGLFFEGRQKQLFVNEKKFGNESPILFFE